MSVVCGPVQLLPDRSDTATNPVILAEVLSGATEEYDRGDKFNLFQSIPTLGHYILVSQTEILVDHFYRTQQNQWQSRTLRSLSENIQIAEPALDINLSEIFRRVF